MMKLDRPQSRCIPRITPEFKETSFIKRGFMISRHHIVFWCSRLPYYTTGCFTNEKWTGSAYTKFNSPTRFQSIIQSVLYNEYHCRTKSKQLMPTYPFPIKKKHVQSVVSIVRQHGIYNPLAFLRKHSMFESVVSNRNLKVHYAQDWTHNLYVSVYYCIH